jgi:hypothetical protein
MTDSRSALSAARMPLLTFHQALIQAERRNYEAAHGPITPAQFFQELLNGKSLLWLKPLTALILTIDERLDEGATPPESFAESRERLYRMLTETQPNGVVEHVAALRRAAPALPALQQAVLTALGTT